MADQELQAWREEVLKMAEPIMKQLDAACPYYKVIVTPRGATLTIDEAYVHNPKYDQRNANRVEEVEDNA